jgi:two-component system, LuxR family, response regulator FixJ
MSTSRKIMLVDDDPAVRAALVFSLELHGFDVEACANGEEAIERANWRSAACLVIEQRLAEGNGLALLSRLRRRGLLAPAVILTTNPTRRLRRQVSQAGAALVEKPLLTDTLVAALHLLTGDGRAAASTAAAGRPLGQFSGGKPSPPCQ